MSVRFDDLPSGSTFRPLARVTDRGDVELIDEDGKVVTTAGGLGKTEVDPVAFALHVGDVLREAATGDTRVVMWVDDNGTGWSSSPGTQPRLMPQGWVKVGRLGP